LEELLADNNIELVIVNTPSVTHYDYAKQVILAGKNLVVEKPFTATVEQADELIRLAREKNVKHSVYQNRRYDSDYKTVKKVLDDGSIGKIIEAEIRYDRFVPELSYKTHKESPTAAVGALYDLGSHLIDQALQLFGMPVAVSGDMMINRPGSQVDDYFDLKLFYPSHRVSLKSSYYVREPLPGYVFNGTKGTFIKAKTDVQEKMLQANISPDTENWGTEPENEKGLLHTEVNGEIIKKHIESLRGNYAEYYEGIYQALRNNKALPVTAEQGRDVIIVIEAAWKSHRERRVVDL